VLWQNLDFSGNGNYTPLEEPAEELSSSTDHRQALFSLPNGLLAFATLDPNDKFVSEASLQFAQRQSLPARTPVACLGCHASGLIPVVDEFRAIIIENARDIGIVTKSWSG